MKLQLLIAKMNSNLEDQCESVSMHLLKPKVLRDVESLQQEFKLLQTQMFHVQQQLNATNADTETSIQTLVHLDQFKNRIQVQLIDCIVKLIIIKRYLVLIGHLQSFKGGR